VGAQITITTRGFGHRVGMSQYGADAMALNGSTYPQILAHYYRGTSLSILENG
jgi:stage II sporulation protein D